MCAKCWGEWTPAGLHLWARGAAPTEWLLIGCDKVIPMGTQAGCGGWWNKAPWHPSFLG